MDTLQVAKTILEQIRYGVVANTKQRVSGAYAMVCWGANNFGAFAAPGYYGGLQFTVEGKKYQGLVQICLNPHDYYTIFLQDRPTIEDIDFENLAEVLDRYIET
jgi:hypothetical protein